MNSHKLPVLKPLVGNTNNFDFLRLLFALLVIVTHSYPLSGLPEQDLLFRFSHGQELLSHLSVKGFLIISGFLITKSLLRSQNLSDYFYKRALRVFPALWVLLIITVFICFFFSNKSLISYLSHYSIRDYIFYNAVLKTQYNLDGVFKTNPYPNAINGSLWTIPYEFFFYIVLSCFYFFRTSIWILRWSFASLFVGLGSMFLVASPNLYMFHLPFWSLQGNHLAELGAFFSSGAFYAVLSQPTIKTRQLLTLVAVVVIVASLALKGFIYVQFLFLPILIISFGSLNISALSKLKKYGDFSYGIYLWGFFVQQALMHLLHLRLFELMISSILITCVCGAISWHLVEKQALRLKLRLKPASVFMQ